MVKMVWVVVVEEANLVVVAAVGRGDCSGEGLVMCWGCGGGNVLGQRDDNKAVRRDGTKMKREEEFLLLTCGKKE